MPDTTHIRIPAGGRHRRTGALSRASCGRRYAPSRRAATAAVRRASERTNTPDIADVTSDMGRIYRMTCNRCLPARRSRAQRVLRIVHGTCGGAW